MRFEKDTVVLHRSFYDMDMSLAELVVYATIFGYCQDGESKFYGSRDILAEKAKCTDRTIRTVLASLQEKGYIKKCQMVVNGVPKVAFEAVEIISNDRKIFPNGQENISAPLNSNIYNNTNKENKEENKDTYKEPASPKTLPVNKIYISSTERAALGNDPDRIAELKAKKFRERCRDAAHEVGMNKEQFEAFVAYYTQHNDRSEKLECETKEIFDKKKRMRTWMSRSYNKPSTPSPQPQEKKYATLRAMTQEEIDNLYK